MKGIILAGGTGSRLFPLTKVTNKHLLPVGQYPMIYYPIAKLANAGITEILIVTGKEHMGAVVNLLGSGHDFGLEFTYKIQDQPGGIAQALSLAENFVGRERCVVILGDNIFEDDLTESVKNYSVQKNGAKILLKEVPDPHRYGVAEMQGNNILSIEEKPKQPKSNCAVTGIYMYDADVFNIIKTLKPSGRGEMEITDVNNAYIERGNMTYDTFKGWWTDAGTFPSLVRATELAKDMEIHFGALSDPEAVGTKQEEVTE
ncbi:MAG TPA: sugar phosphate nucleotidyltransferase [Patescibacteria group bacterium]|nr:sugar phosphate nucleotidyltransferase [Patescibacteria group bacterium]